MIPGVVTYRIEAHSSNPERAWLVMDCPSECRIPLRQQPASGATWQWDGNAGRPTITPSIDCKECRRHFTITKGNATLVCI